MALTRPNLENILTNVVMFTDSMTVLHAGATQANVDVGFLMNRANGLVPNAAFYWSESTQSFVTALTANAGTNSSNITVQSYANITAGSITGILTTVSQPNITTLSGLTTIGGSTLTISGPTTHSSTVSATAFYAPTIGNTGASLTGSTASISTWANIAGPLVVNNNTAVQAIQVVGTSTKGGTGYHDFLLATNQGGGTNPNKSFRLDSLGTFQIINSAYTATIFSLTDGGVLGGFNQISVGGSTGSSGQILSSTGTGLQWTAAGGFSGGSVPNQTTFASNLVASSGTASISNTTGALVAVGGVGISGNLNAGAASGTLQNQLLSGTQSAPTAGTFLSGAHTVLSGAGGNYLAIGQNASSNFAQWIQSGYPASSGAVYYPIILNPLGGNVVVGTTTTSTSTTTGALVVQGGTGIAGNLYVGGNFVVAGTQTTVNTETINNTEYVATINATNVYSATVGNIGSNVVGTGTYLTSLNASNLSSGTVPLAQLTGITTTQLSGTAGITNAQLANSSLTVNGTSISLGGSGTVTAAAGTLTGSTLNSTVTASSLTSVGTLTGLTVSGLVTQSLLTASTPTAILTHGSDNNFQLTAQNGVSTNATSTEVARFGINYNTAGWDSFTQYVRGGGAQTGYQTLWAANTAIMTVQSGSVVPVANATTTLGSSGAWWSTVYGTAIHAQYADLAENYTADTDYAPGTVVVFGGDAEITTTTTSHDPRVAGVISTNPAYLMNGSTPGLPVAMTGRVPCQVQGPVTKGQVLVTSTTAGVAEAINNSQFVPGCVVGKALEAINTNTIETIEVVVGRF